MLPPNSTIHQKLSYPKNMRLEDLSCFRTNWHFTYQEPQIKTFDEVRFNSLAHIYRNGRIIVDSFSDALEGLGWQMEPKRFYHWKHYIPFLLKNYGYFKHQATLDEAYVFMSTWYDGYYEWLGVCLPRLLFVLERQIPGLPLVPRIQHLKKITETLDLLKIPYYEVQGNHYVKVKKLYLSPLQEPISYSNPLYIQQTRQVLLNAVFGPDWPKPTLKLYITRNHTASRGIHNEDELLPILEAHGFTPIVPEKMSLVETIQAFAQAQIIVGPHGAGMANMIFMQPGGRVWEWNNPDSTPITYCVLAQNLNHDYYYYFADAIVDDHHHHHKKSLYLHPDNWLKTLQQVVRV